MISKIADVADRGRSADEMVRSRPNRRAVSAKLGMACALEQYRARLNKRSVVGTDYRSQGIAAVTYLQLAEAIARIGAAERLLGADGIELDRRAAAS